MQIPNETLKEIVDGLPLENLFEKFNDAYIRLQRVNNINERPFESYIVARCFKLRSTIEERINTVDAEEANINAELNALYRIPDKTIEQWGHLGELESRHLKNIAIGNRLHYHRYLMTVRYIDYRWDALNGQE